MIILRYFYKTFESEFGEDVTALQRHLSVLKDEATLCHRLKMHKLVAEGREEALEAAQLPSDQEQVRKNLPSSTCSLREIGRANFSSSQQRINQWLSPLDCRSRLAEIDAIRHPGSGAWLLENKAYMRWKDDVSVPLLWISGDPGIGKTVLSSSIVNDIEMGTDSAVVYFHSDAGDESSRTTLGLLTSLIAQLKGQYQTRSPTSSSPECLLQAYETSVKYGRPYISQADTPEFIVEELISVYEQTIVVIDGLDEMAEPDSTIEALLKLSKQSESLRIVFLSRPIPVIRKKLQHLPQIALSPAELKQDIRSYVLKKSEDIPLDEVAGRESIVNDICTKAEGMFLWARMVMDDLSAATSLSHIQDILAQCPPGLYGMYSHFLRGLAAQSPERQRLTRDILRWVVCAARPLTVEELQSALATTLEGDNEKPFRSVVIEACSPFVIVSTNGGFVRPVHHSVREFLVQETSPLRLEGTISSFFVPPKETHAELALRCAKYVNTNSSGWPETWTASSNPYGPFHSYALASWCYHTVSGQYRADLDVQIGRLTLSSEKRQAWLYHMLFTGSGESYPFQMILRLQSRLEEWAEGRDPADAQSSTEGLSVSEREWSMDALELLLMLPSYRRSEHGGESSAHSNVDISYFETMMVMRDLARRLTQGGNLKPAIARLESVRTSLSSSSGPPDTRFMPRVSFLLNTLGMLYDQQGLTKLSRDVHWEALTIQTAAAGGGEFGESKDPEAVWTINELGRVLRHLGQHTEAVQLHRSALQVLTKTLAADHPERLWTMATMARALREQNLPEEALELHLETYNARCKSPGKLHPHTLWSCGDVAKCYRDMGRFEDALVSFQRALDGRLESLGPRHPDTLWSMNHVGLVLVDLGRHEEAIEMQKRALEGQAEVLGAEHKHTTWTRTVVEELASIT